MEKGYLTNFYRHIGTNHSTTEGLECKYCKLQHSDKEELLMHVIKSHAESLIKSDEPSNKNLKKVNISHALEKETKFEKPFFSKSCLSEKRASICSA